jgi:capsular exopolysaccharide synthesis family protein
MNAITRQDDPAFDPNAGLERPEQRGKQLSFADTADSPLIQYLSIVRRRIWLVLGIIASALLLALYITYSTIPLYRASTTIEISREASRVLEQDDTMPANARLGTEFYQTQYGLIASRSVAAGVVRKLRLADNPTLLAGYDGSNSELAMQAPRQQRTLRAIAIVRQNTQVEPVRNSGLVNIRFSSPDPELSALVSKAIAETYIETNLQRRFDANNYAREFLESELQRVRAALEESEQRVVTYANNSDILEINRHSNTEGTQPGQSVPEMSLQVLNNSLAEATANRIAAEARARAQSGDAALNDSGLMQLRGQRAQLQAEYSRNLATLRPEYPSMVALRGQIDSLDRSIAQQTQRIGESQNSEYRAALAQERQLQARVDALTENVQQLSQRRIQYNIFQRDADTNRALYDSLLERYKEIGVAGGVGSNNVAIVDPAEVPAYPFTPQPLMNILLALLGGAAFGLAAAFLLEQLDGAIKSPVEIENGLGLPVLGVIPNITIDSLIGDLKDRKSVISESYLSVHTSLRFSTSHGVPTTLTVTSANASEGKSTTALSTAAMIARMGKSVLIIDADMRNPSLHKTLGIENEVGLADLLTGDDPASARTYSVPDLGVMAITAGPIPPNPAELLATDRLSELLAYFTSKFDHVVVDAPPVMGLSDAPLVASTVEACIFVITSGSTGTKAAIGALRRLQDVDANVIGAVLSRYSASDVGYGYNYNYSYDYGSDRNKRSMLQRFSLKSL